MRQLQHPTTPLLAVLVLTVIAAAGCSTVQVSKDPDSPGSDTPVETAQRNGHWQFDASARPPADRDGYQPPRKLAVLLPLTGDLAAASQPVRDGLLAGYYGERRTRPELQFYDTAATSAGAVAAYQKAVADGADQILGPLGREQVDAVFRDPRPGTMVLALNRGTLAAPTDAGSFSLAPEDDGTSAADYLLSRKALRVIVLSSGEDYARRSVAAFDKQLQSSGGRVVRTLAVVGDKPADMTALLQQAMQADGGADAVFLALRGSAARGVAPQLAAAGLAVLPRVATSQLVAGTGKAEQDRALDGIAFPAERWGSSPVNGLPNPAAVASTLSTARGPAAKLFAFGYDAWLLSAYLPHLATSADASVDGATGVLRIGPAGNVLRIPAWSTFSGGYVVPLATAAGG